MSAEVFKVQTEVTATGVLVYNEDRSTLFQLGGGDAKTVIDHLKMGPREKRFVIAEIDQDGTFQIGQETADPYW